MSWNFSINYIINKKRVNENTENEKEGSKTVSVFLRTQDREECPRAAGNFKSEGTVV